MTYSFEKISVVPGHIDNVLGVTKRELFTIVAMHTLAAGGYAKWEHLAQDAVSLADATLAALAANRQEVPRG